MRYWQIGLLGSFICSLLSFLILGWLSTFLYVLSWLFFAVFMVKVLVIFNKK